ncbi:hypothetical protein FOL47_000282, partial [Perkinsus chesapeaki]
MASPGLSERIDAAQVDISALRGKAQVGDDLWAKMCDVLSGEEDGLSSVADLGFMHPEDISDSLSSLETSRDRSRAALLFELCRSACGLPNVLMNTCVEPLPPPRREGEVEPSSSEDTESDMPRKKVKMSLFIDSVDDSTFPVISSQSFDALVANFRLKFGDVEDSELPNLEQLSGIR